MSDRTGIFQHAIFNPSIVAHPDQDGAPKGGLRFIMSLRATGEGHISSIEFRAGTIKASGEITLDPVSRYVAPPEVIPDPTYHKPSFTLKLQEMGLEHQFITLGIGPMREYSIGAVLLDLEDPTRVVGRLREPLVSAAPEEREGYVTNVVYSCGAMLHGDTLVLPYAISDRVTVIATTPLGPLLEALQDG